MLLLEFVPLKWVLPPKSCLNKKVMQLFQNLQIISLMHEASSETWLDLHEIYTYQATFKFGKNKIS